MNQPAEVQPTDIPSGGMPEKPPRGKKGCGCWTIFFSVLGIILLFVIIGVAYIVSAVNWVKNAAEPTPAVYPDTTISTEEESELQRIYLQYRKCYDTKQDFDVTFTPRLFNAFVERELKKKQEAGTAKSDDPLRLYFQFDGEEIVARGTLKAKAANSKEDQYVNFEARGKLDIESGRLKADLHSLKLAGKEAPWLVMWFFRWTLEQAEAGNLKDNSGQGQQPLEGIKLLRREGERVHLIWDGNDLRDPDKEER